ncbi:MAG: nitronate monooxygenase [Rhodospirillaceae bacterium]|nr:nitronate monooxygenase [Rhodospirillaceae bacterium]
MHNALVPLTRAKSFMDDFNLKAPILLAPMPGATPAALSIAVASGGGMGACGVLLMTEDQITEWVSEMRSGSNGAFQLNTWIPDPKPNRDRVHETEIRQFLSNWGPAVSEDAGDAPAPDFKSQCEAMLEAGPAVISSIMGLYPPEFVSRMKAKQIKWFAKVTTVKEAIEAEKAGADVVVAQGMEAGGHKGAFHAVEANSNMVGMFSLLPAVCDVVNVPVVASGGVGDPRSVAAALILGASAVEIGTGFLRSPEAGISKSWADGIGVANPEDTLVSRVFSGRLGRSLRTAYATSATLAEAPDPAPYPIQRNLTKAMRDEAVRSDKLDGMQAWAGQSSKFAREMPAQKIVIELWNGAQRLLGAR